MNIKKQNITAESGRYLGGLKTRPLVLVVDDDEDQCLLFRTLLQTKGLEVVSATSARVALEILRSIHVDIVVCDVCMPEINGRDFVEQVRKARDLAKLPVIAFTAAGDLLREELLESGADRFCSKSSPHQLVQQIAAVLAERQHDHKLLEQIQTRFSH